MVSSTLLALLDMPSIEEYFQYVIDSRVNGQHTQSKELFRHLSEGMQGQRANFFRWYEESYTPTESDRRELKKYFNM